MTSIEIMEMKEIDKAPRVIRLILFFVRPRYHEIHVRGADILMEYKKFMRGTWFIRANVYVRINLN